MRIEDTARIIEAEASVLDYQGKLAVAQCILDNRFNANAFTRPAKYYSAASLMAAEDVILRGKRRFPDAKILQFRSFSKYGKNGEPDWEKIYSGKCPIPSELEYLGKDGSGEFGHFYFGRRDVRRWDEAVKTALHAYVHRDKYVYLYGAKGVLLTRDTIHNYFAMEPAYFARYNAEQREQIIRNSVGKVAYDCSGFVGWLCTGDKRYSLGQFENAHDKTQDLKAGPAGSILITTYGGSGRHIGLDIGYGFCCDMAYESTDENIRNGRAGVRFYNIHEGICPWEWSAQSNVLDYAGADAR